MTIPTIPTESPAHFYLIFKVDKISNPTKLSFFKLIHCMEETCRYELIELNNLKSEDENKSITNLKTPNSYHCISTLRPSPELHPLKIFYEAIQLKDDF